MPARYRCGAARASGASRAGLVKSLLAPFRKQGGQWLHRAANDERPWGAASPAFCLSVSTLKDPTHFGGRHHVLEVPLSGVLTARDAKVRTWAAEDASCWPGELQAAVSRRRRD